MKKNIILCIILIYLIIYYADMKSHSSANHLIFVSPSFDKIRIYNRYHKVPFKTSSAICREDIVNFDAENSNFMSVSPSLNELFKSNR